MQVVVIGGGIGGLACAIGLRNGGHDVTVLEKVPAMAEIGAGINITPNATRALKALGVLPQVLESANFPESAAILRYDHFQKLSEQKLGQLMTDLYGTPYIVIHRYDLHAVLYLEAKRLGVQVLLGQSIASIDTKIASVTTEHGTTFKADLIIAADGERSFCREIVTGQNYPSKDSGDHVFRVIIPGDAVRKNSPELAHLVDRPSINLLIGPGGHAMTYSLKRDGLLNIVLTMKHEGVEDPPQFPHPVDLSEAKEAFRGWTAIQGLLESAAATARWTLLDTEMPKTWVKDKVLLVGDAAHVMLPYLGQGAAMALEDAVVLSTLLKDYHPAENSELGPVLEQYTELRQERVRYVKEKARSNRDIYALPDGKDQITRDNILAAESERIKNGEVDEAGNGDANFAKDSPNFLADVQFRNLLFGYDAEQEASARHKLPQAVV